MASRRMGDLRAHRAGSLNDAAARLIICKDKGFGERSERKRGRGRERDGGKGTEGLIAHWLLFHPAAVRAAADATGQVFRAGRANFA